MTARNAKKILRREMRIRTHALDAGERELAGERLAQRVLESPEFVSALRVALYGALPDEIPTRSLFDRARECGKTVVMPRWLDAGSIEFAPVADWGLLIEGPRGILEPPPGVPTQSSDSIDLVVVPGRAFDCGGGRLGRGAGAYDRTFPVGMDAPRLLGACYAFQLVESVPRDSFDRRMDGVVTDQALAWVPMNRSME